MASTSSPRGIPSRSRSTAARAPRPGPPTPTSSLGLAYEPLSDQYNYTWDTDRAWNGTCRQLIVLLKDGTEKRANFRLH